MNRVSAYKKRSLWMDVWKRLRRNKAAILGIILFAVIFLVCVASPLFLSLEDDVLAINTRNMLEGPSRSNLLGTDELGRDVLARILWGGRTTFLISLSALVVAFTIGAILGTVSVYYGRYSDAIVMRFVDIIMSIPTVIFMITLATIMRPTMTSLIIVVGLGLMPNHARLIRGQVLQVVDNEYIEAVRLQGASDFKIIMYHILPNAISPVITTVILDISFAVMTVSTLSFLGLGVQAPYPEWGGMLASGRQHIRHAPHISTIPGIALVLTLLSLTLVGDGVRDALDPKMKR